MRSNAVSSNAHSSAALAVEPQIGTSEATLVPTTTEAEESLGGRASLCITSVPYRVGREGRFPNAIVRAAIQAERRLRIKPQLNDVYLFEPMSPRGFYISREHFTIER